MPTTDRRAFKKRIIIAFAIILLVLMLMYGITLIIPFFEQSIVPQESDFIADFDFYPVDYDENIFEDPKYTSLIQDGILLYDNNSNLTTTVDKSNSNQFGSSVALMVDMVYAIVNGDAKEYNSYFSEKYFESNSPKSEFTMQKIYNGKITYCETENVNEDGNVYTRYTYKLIYNIYENNGTFRMDIGDGAREQYITVSDREGKLLIDSIQYIRYYN